MARSNKHKKRKALLPDPVYGSRLITRIINRVMKDGKKEVATNLVYDSLTIIKEKMKTDNPLVVLRQALENIKPLTEVRSRRVGGAAYQVPVPVKG